MRSIIYICICTVNICTYILNESVLINFKLYYLPSPQLPKEQPSSLSETCVFFVPFFFFLRYFLFASPIQELNSFNYLDLYKLADLFNLTLLENAVVDFLVKHLSELLKNHPEEVLALPYCLLREVFKSDRLTSLSEEQIWQVRRLVNKQNV